MLIKLGPIEVGLSGEITYHPEKSEFPSGMSPLLLSGGVFTCQSPGGTVIEPFFKY